MTTVSGPSGNIAVPTRSEPVTPQQSGGVVATGPTTSTTPPPTDLKTLPGQVLGFLAGAPEIAKPSQEALAAAFSGNMDSEMLSEIAALLMQASGEEQVNAAGRKAELQNEGVKEASRKNLEKIKEHFEELRKSEKWGIFGKIFGYIAAVVAVAAAVFTGGATLVLAGAALALTVAQDLGITEWLMDAAGIPKEAQGWIMMGLTVVLCLASVGTALKTLLSKAPQIAKGFCSNIGQKVTQFFGENAGKVKSGVNIASGVAQTGSGTAQIGTAFAQRKSTMAEAALKQSEADMARAQKFLEERMEDFKDAIEKMNSTISDAIMAMLSSNEGKMATIHAI
jgi:hypothetical protein